MVNHSRFCWDNWEIELKLGNPWQLLANLKVTLWCLAICPCHSESFAKPSPDTAKWYSLSKGTLLFLLSLKFSFSFSRRQSSSFFSLSFSSRNFLLVTYFNISWTVPNNSLPIGFHQQLIIQKQPSELFIKKRCS